MRELLTNALPNDIALAEVSPLARVITVLFAYNPGASRAYGFTPQHHFGFEAAA